MSTLLQINTSIFAGAGQSSRLADTFTAAWKARHPDGQVIIRDLAAQPLPHLDADRFQALLTPADQRTAEQQAVVALSDQLIDELRQADQVVLGVPMYNFGIPSQLKAYFDHVARAGVTFRYTANGSEGLLKNRPVHIMAARGGIYAGTEADTQSAYLRDFLRFIGLTDVRFVYAEGLAISDDSRETSLQQARDHIQRHAA